MLYYIESVTLMCLFRLQLHGLRDVKTKPSCWAGGRPQTGVRGQEGQTECTAASHPEIQDRLHRVCQEGQKVSCPLRHCLYFKMMDAFEDCILQVGHSLLASQVRRSPGSISGCSSRDQWRGTAGHGDPSAGEEVSELRSGHGVEKKERGQQVRLYPSFRCLWEQKHFHAHHAVTLLFRAQLIMFNSLVLFYGMKTH